MYDLRWVYDPYLRVGQCLADLTDDEQQLARCRAQDRPLVLKLLRELPSNPIRRRGAGDERAVLLTA